MIIYASKRNTIVCLLFSYSLITIFNGVVQAQEYSQQQLQIFNEITKGVKVLSDENWAYTAIAPLKPDIIPLFWGSRKAYTGDIRWPQNSYPPVAIASEYQKGRFVALGHDGLLIDPSANDIFTANIFNWLGNGYKHKKIIIYTFLGEWFNKTKLTSKAKELIASQSIEITELDSKVTNEDLNNCDLFIIVRPSRTIEENEISSIVSYVEQGGSLLMTGMGWFWESTNKTPDISSFPLNRLGKQLGFEYSRTSINVTPSNNKEETQRYSHIILQRLSTRKPIEVKNYSIKKHDNNFISKDVALNRNKYHYVVEGEHVIVSMPYRFWRKCRKPVDFITRLDAVYKVYADLTDGIKPFYGNKITILNVDNLKFHMSSGNPILSRQDRIQYILEELEKSDYQNPSWGLMHELGHDFITELKHYFVFGNGDNESWAEFLALYSCYKLDLKPDKEPAWLTTAKNYHESGEKDFERIKNQSYVMIGFLHHIQQQYGWDVFKKLFKIYANLVRENNYSDFDETERKVNLFVKELSIAAGVNFYPYFYRWGFPLNESINEELQYLPGAKLFK